VLELVLVLVLVLTVLSVVEDVAAVSWGFAAVFVVVAEVELGLGLDFETMELHKFWRLSLRICTARSWSILFC